MTLHTYDQRCGKYLRFFSTRKVFISASFSLLHIGMKCASHFCSETANENKQFKETKTLFIIHTWSEKVSEGTVVNRPLPYFAWRFTWNYAYSPFNEKISPSSPHAEKIHCLLWCQIFWSCFLKTSMLSWSIH